MRSRTVDQFCWLEEASSLHCKSQPFSYLSLVGQDPQTRVREGPWLRHLHWLRAPAADVDHVSLCPCKMVSSGNEALLRKVSCFLQDQSAASQNGPGPSISSAEEPTKAPAEESPPQPYNENRMNVVLVGAECAPWSKTGSFSHLSSSPPCTSQSSGDHVAICSDTEVSWHFQAQSNKL